MPELSTPATTNCLKADIVNRANLQDLSFVHQTLTPEP
jgi:hypothetical protein